MACGMSGTTRPFRRSAVTAGSIAVIDAAMPLRWAELGEPATRAGLSCFASSRCQRPSVSTLSGFPSLSQHGQAGCAGGLLLIGAVLKLALQA